MKIFNLFKGNKVSSDERYIDIENRLSKLERDVNSYILDIDDKLQHYLEIKLSNLDKVFSSEKKKAGRPRKVSAK